MTSIPTLPLATPRPTSPVPTDPCTARIERLWATREHIQQHRAEVLALLTESSTHQAASYEIDAALRTLSGAAAEQARHRPPTVRTLAAFMPSNVLLYSYVLYLMVPSLYVERVAFRPSSQVLSQTARLHELLAPVHRLPITNLQISQRAFLTGAAAEADVVVFTGSYQNAERIRQHISPDQLFLFFGAGVNPFVVTAGADVGRAVSDAVAIRLLNSGQDCLAPDVFYVHRDVAGTFTAALTARLREARYGSYTDATADYGPIFYDGALEEAAGYLARHRRRIVHGGCMDLRARRLDPAVLLHRLGREGAADRLLLAGEPDAARAALTAPLPAFALRGRDVLALGVPPGPRVSRVLAEVEDRWLAEGLPDEGRQRALLAEVVGRR